MFQLKFCLKIFETSSLLCVSVLKCSILAIIFFEFLLLNLSAGRGKIVQARAPCPLLLAPMGALQANIYTMLKTSLETDVAANKPCRGFLKAHFSSFFARSMGVVADRVLQTGP